MKGSPEFNLNPNPQPDQNEPIGDRKLTVFEEANMGVCGLTPEEVKEMTPKELEDLSDITADLDGLHLGS